MPIPLFFIRGIGEAVAQQLREAGITCVEEFYQASEEKLQVVLGWNLPRIQWMKKLAEAKIFGYCFRMGNVPVPSSSLALDIETSPSFSYIWLIGICYNGSYFRFYADTPSQEPIILQQATRFLQEYPEPILIYSGSGFDAEVLRRRWKHHFGSHLEIDRSRFQDVLKWMNSYLILPLKHYRLKEVGVYFGYPFRFPHKNGWDCALAYVRHLKTGKPVPSWVFLYNEDDTRSVLYLSRIFQQLPSIKS
ncbi:MAG: ribonuclease H-like domain-containing protein [bacterium JZ-2024 1]